MNSALKRAPLRFLYFKKASLAISCLDESLTKMRTLYSKFEIGRYCVVSCGGRETISGVPLPPYLKKLMLSSGYFSSLPQSILNTWIIRSEGRSYDIAPFGAKFISWQLQISSALISLLLSFWIIDSPTHLYRSRLSILRSNLAEVYSSGRRDFLIIYNRSSCMSRMYSSGSRMTSSKW